MGHILNPMPKNLYNLFSFSSLPLILTITTENVIKNPVKNQSSFDYLLMKMLLFYSHFTFEMRSIKKVEDAAWMKLPRFLDYNCLVILICLPNHMLQEILLCFILSASVRCSFTEALKQISSCFGGLP